MNNTIINKIQALGGNTDAVNTDKSFIENWKSIKFNHHLYDKDWDVYGHELPYGQYFVKDWMFTPFKEGSEDQEEFEDLIDVDYVQEVVGISKPDFLCIFYSYGYPDHYFVCISDVDQSNPVVYSTDHEVYFDELENEGNFEEFLDRFMTKEEFQEVVTGYLTDKFGKN